VRIAMLTGRQFLIEEGGTLHARIYRLEAEVSMLRHYCPVKNFENSWK
jgi:hypothetical protein